MAQNFEDIAKQFVEFYYNQFDADRKQLTALYRAESMLTFESSAVLGAQGIVEKLAGLPFEQVKHQVSTMDAQPSVGNGVVVLVTGQLLVDEEQRPMNYTQAFHLRLEEASGQYYVHNDLFKLVYG